MWMRNARTAKGVVYTWKFKVTVLSFLRGTLMTRTHHHGVSQPREGKAESNDAETEAEELAPGDDKYGVASTRRTNERRDKSNNQPGRI